MIDIRATGFLKCPKEDLHKIIKEGTVGIVGHGYVGQAVEAMFKYACNVVIHDTKIPGSKLDTVVEKSEVIFLCLPTPMREDGSCHTTIIENVLEDLRNKSLALGRPLDSFVVVIKSTVPPGFTEKMQERFLPMRITFSPEFLTERNAIDDFLNCNRIIVAGFQEDANVVLSYFCGVKRVYEKAMRTEERKVIEKYSKLLGNKELLDYQIQGLLDQYYVDRGKSSSNFTMLVHEEIPAVAELAKLFANGFLFNKVIFCNEVYQMCNKLGINYNEVKALAVMDERVGTSHTKVPGLDGKLAASGSCFPKDINNLIASCKYLGVDEKLFSAVWKRNVELRPEKDWEKLEGRAVVKGE